MFSGDEVLNGLGNRRCGDSSPVQTPLPWLPTFKGLEKLQIF